MLSSDPLLDREIELQLRRLVGELLKYGGRCFVK